MALKLTTLNIRLQIEASSKTGNEAILRLLLEYGADPNIVDNVTHCTPWDWAFEKFKVKAILAEFGGKGAAELGMR